MDKIDTKLNFYKLQSYLNKLQKLQYNEQITKNYREMNKLHKKITTNYREKKGTITQKKLPQITEKKIEKIK